MAEAQPVGELALRTGRVPADVDPCVALWLAAVADRDGGVDHAPVRARITAKFAAPVLRFAVVEAPTGGAVAGFALTVTTTGDDGAELELLAVDPGRAGHGLGRRLLQDAVQHARAAGCRWLQLRVRAGNDRARRLYRAAGFGPVSEPQPHPLGGQPMVTYRRELEPDRH